MSTTEADERPTLWFTRHPTPLGEMLLVAETDGLVRVAFPGAFERELAAAARAAGSARLVEDAFALADYTRALDRYFAGEPIDHALPLRPRGTAFQRAVWDRMARIPFGEVCTYGDLAWEVGRPGAARAVGAACGANPLPLFQPCHRVVAAGGSLGGFGGGLDIKRRLLVLEGVELG